MGNPIEVRKVPILKVTDASGLEELIDKGVFKADEVVAVVGKTEGNGGVNDYTRIIADRAFREVLLDQGHPVRGRDQADPARLVRWHRRCAQPARDDLRAAARGLHARHRRAAADRGLRDERADPARGDRPRRHGREGRRRCPRGHEAGRDHDPKDVHYVQTKTPLLTLDTINDAKARGHEVWTEDTLLSMDLSNGTSALGIAVALGEIEMPTDEQIMHDLSLYSSVASCSSGVELDRAQIVLVGNARGVGGATASGTT